MGNKNESIAVTKVFSFSVMLQFPDMHKVHKVVFNDLGQLNFPVALLYITSLLHNVHLLHDRWWHS